MKKYLSLVILNCLVTIGAAQKHEHHNKALNSRSDTIDVLNYEINLDMTNIANQLINGNCVVKFTPKINGVTQLDLDLQGLMVDSVTLGTPLVYTHIGNLVEITLPSTMNINDTAEVTVYYNGSPQKDPSGFGGFYFSTGYAFNLGVAFQDNPHNYGRVWFPCFDNFKERSTYEFNIITGGGQKAHCNGMLISENVITGDTLTRKWVLTEEIPTYLACVAVSDYETVHMNFNGVNNVVPVELVGQASDTTNMKNSFINLNGAFDAYEQCYGPYLWSKVGFSLVPFASGAMEHATNVSYPGFAANGALTYETLMAHEFSHHWWGDLVTCETAEDMWINEGMAVYSEHLFLEKIYDYATSLEEIKLNNKDVIQYAHIDENGFRAISGIPHQYTYGDHVYKKGALVAHNMRAYLGDSLFFYGLQEVLDTYKWQTLNSFQFRDELFNATGVNMTDFFNDWVLNGGFSHFDIDSVLITPNGPNFDCDVFVQQKLRGAPNFHNGTPLEITFYDNNWNKHKDTIVISGQYDNVSVSVPFSPTVYILNEENRLNQARTDNQLVLKAPGYISTLPLTLTKVFNINAVTDSVLLQIEHHWVAPDSIKNNVNNYRISTSRYWSFDGIMPNGFSGDIRLEFDGRSSKGFLDQDLVPVNGDSLILLYRESPKFDWTEYPYYTKTTISSTLAFGWVTIDSLLLGEYTFANSASAIGVDELKKDEINFEVYPNPSDDFLWVNPKSNQLSNNAQIEVYDINGKLIFSENFKSKKRINTSAWKSGNYLLHITDGKRINESHKVLIR
jgi:aminopeptidase N